VRRYEIAVEELAFDELLTINAHLLSASFPDEMATSQD
jgi:hypothetical protein